MASTTGMENLHISAPEGASSSRTPEMYDLLILTDATASMGTYLQSLNKSLPDIIQISALTGCFSRIGVLAYRDYCGGKLTEWSGWHTPGKTHDIIQGVEPRAISQAELLTFARQLQADAGGDIPEATKTGLAHAYQVMRPEASTVMLLYADAPPHSHLTKGHNYNTEITQLEGSRYGGAAHRFVDWVSAAQTLRENGTRVFCIVSPSAYNTTEWTKTVSFYSFLSAQTGGVCLDVSGNCSTENISTLTVGLLLAWMGVEKQGAKLETKELATLAQYKDSSTIGDFKSEDDRAGDLYIPAKQSPDAVHKVYQNLATPTLSMAVMGQVIPRREHPATDPAKRYAVDPDYKVLVAAQLADIIASDVTAIALNPVLGTLWRAVCADRLNPAREALLVEFGLQIEKIKEPEKKERMKSWLEESYDHGAAILELINRVPVEARFPCVFLDPTLNFDKAVSGEIGNEEADSTPLTRDDLLDIGRSCDYRTLRRVGQALTHLTYVNSKDELPLHIRDAARDSVPLIPMALAQPEHKREFWKILLHTVLPGTMLGARPAALLAALSVRMGIKPLEGAAYAELAAWKDKWNTLDIPETWNINCLGLILEADSKSQERGEGPLLNDDDRLLFRTLVDYKLLEMNLDTSLSATIGWCPSKSKMPIGPVVVCKICQFPRSVTIMAGDGVCGPCAYALSVGREGEAFTEAVEGNVSKTDNTTTEATWVECLVPRCRAQYVVYNPDDLRVRPKCHYCRQKSVLPKDHPSYHQSTVAPVVECTQCLSRVIYPPEYRPASLNPEEYKCIACITGRTTLVTEETTARQLADENGTYFLLRNDGNKIHSPLTGRSLFHVISTAGTADFTNQVQILPPTTLKLTIRGKVIQNQPSLLTALRTWITNRRVESGTCSLCFTTAKKGTLTRACGRRGCNERICASCLDSWYGLNAPGRVLNVAALSCPFCRREPSPRTNLPPRVRTLTGVRSAVREAGEWIYVWCSGGCETAKRYERRECARGVAPVTVEAWNCDECTDASWPAGTRIEEVPAIKNCPGCGTPTEKTAGCDHMECSVGGCGKHWCWNCGLAVDQGEIYAHMTEVHGGWYNGRDYNEEEEEEEEEY
ncbi:hypothetical protein B0T22DRAFT_401074 [Podospora appendiculata]|uniref:RBR-type E3 ubiquitin transferase n=1 Tax=Podospora appendiculata TaxID=314037 RepID=A0AAE0XH75_9PEZI|nr:hypothetical protein B0T22DRAFT_401074 [Podospora appendiculata]